MVSLKKAKPSVYSFIPSFSHSKLIDKKATGEKKGGSKASVLIPTSRDSGPAIRHPDGQDLRFTETFAIHSFGYPNYATLGTL
jgi:hypothetical protein